MSHTNTKDLAKKLEKISTQAVKSNLVPLITKNGILMGSYLIKPHDGMFDVIWGSQTLYKTYSKSAAMIIVKMLLSRQQNENIMEVIDADRIAFNTRNDLEIYKYHYKNAEKRNDFLKRDMILSRFDVANERYQQAKKILQESYSSLF
jgi:hypothetical protein